MRDIHIKSLNSRPPKQIEVNYIESENNGAVEVFIDMVKPDLLKSITDEEAYVTRDQNQKGLYNKTEGTICRT